MSIQWDCDWVLPILAALPLKKDVTWAELEWSAIAINTAVETGHYDTDAIGTAAGVKELQAISKASAKLERLLREMHLEARETIGEVMRQSGVRNVTGEIGALVHHAEFAARLLANGEQIKARKAPNPTTKEVTDVAGRAFKDLTGRDPTMTWNNYNGLGASGHFFDLVSSIFAHAGIEANTEASIKAYRKRQKSGSS